MAAERHAAVAVIRHDRGDDESHAGIDSAVLVFRRVVGEDIMTQTILDVEDWRLAVADTHRGQGRRRGRHVRQPDGICAERQAHPVLVGFACGAAGFTQAGQPQAMRHVDHCRDPRTQLDLQRRDVQ